ncbi:OTU domain-containing protein [Endozoicomonas elysicola]|uniref:OTU domain-containing protein n=2 Tax=Endozoicomonas elysicola TaxID=305900 RepID=A0A081K8R5_9GAMM|nr:OTU domain-containing protein [Endozoicomonas elysicola]KEI70541.1 hypothetical protein GV64_07120 [Endozoicomonas elysicola]
MLNSVKTFLPKVSGLARQLPKKGVSNSYFNQRPVSQFAARQRYTAQLVSPPASFERNRLTSQTGIAQAIMPVSASVQPGIRNRNQGLFGGTSSVIASGNPTSGPAAPTPRPLQQAVANQNISARNNHLMDAPIPDSVIQESIRTHAQEERKRAADAQARADALNPQLQRDIAIAIEASQKTLQAENARSASQAAILNSGNCSLAKALQQSNQQYLMEQQAIARQKSAVANMLAEFGYRFQDVPRDGNCFYHALCTHNISPETLARIPDSVRRELAYDMRLGTAQRAKAFHSHYRYSIGSEFEAGLYYRLGEGNELQDISKEGYFANVDDISFAAQIIERPMMVINRFGKTLLAVDKKGKPQLGIHSLENAYRLNLTDSFGRTVQPMIMILDQAIEDKPESNHFMLATR